MKKKIKRSYPFITHTNSICPYRQKIKIKKNHVNGRKSNMALTKSMWTDLTGTSDGCSPFF